MSSAPTIADGTAAVEVRGARKLRRRDPFEYPRDLVLVLDPQGRILFANQGWRRALGYGKEEPLPATVFDVTTSDDRAACRAWLLLCPPAVSEVRVQIRFLAKDGREVPLAGIVAARMDGDLMTGLQGVFRDLAEQAWAERHHRDRAELFRLLSVHAPMGVFQTDPRGRLSYTNDRWRRIASLLHVEQPRGVWWQMVHPDDRERLLGQWRSALEHHHDLLAEFRVQTPTDTECWVRTRIAQARGPSGALECWLGFTEEITAHRQAEAARSRSKEELERRVQARTAELQAANRELTEFASVVAHDLKAPLRAVSRLAEWLIEDHAAALDPAGTRLCHLLHQRVRHLHQLIEGILAYTRIGRVVEDEIPVDLNELLAQVLQSLAPPPAVRVVVPPDLPVVIGVPERLHQVFQNLLDNAIKYLDKPDGRIELRARYAPGGWHFCVSDDGPGIPARYHEKVFQVFHRLEIHARVPGTGMGLALVKRILETRGGTVWFESEPAHGTTVHFTWPDRPPRPAESSAT